MRKTLFNKSIRELANTVSGDVLRMSITSDTEFLLAYYVAQYGPVNTANIVREAYSKVKHNDTAICVFLKSIYYLDNMIVGSFGRLIAKECSDHENKKVRLWADWFLGKRELPIVSKKELYA